MCDFKHMITEAYSTRIVVNCYSVYMNGTNNQKSLSFPKTFEESVDTFDLSEFIYRFNLINYELKSQDYSKLPDMVAKAICYSVGMEGCIAAFCAYETAMGEDFLVEEDQYNEVFAFARPGDDIRSCFDLDRLNSAEWKAEVKNFFSFENDG